MANIGSRQRRTAMSLVLLLVAALWATPSCLAQQVTPYPPGVYGMWPVNEHISSSQTQCSPTLATPTDPYSGQLLLANTGVVGILLEVPWTSVDTGLNAPSLDWTMMNQLLTEAQLCGLRVALSLSMPLDNQAPAGPPGLPPWVAGQITCSPPSCPNGMMIKQTVVNLSTDSTNICQAPTSTNNCLCPAMDSQGNCLAPAYWDQTFNSDRVAFFQQGAANIATLPTAVAQNIVAVLPQFSGATGDDSNIPHTFPSDCTAWKNAGYSTSIMLAAGQTILNAAAAAFPSLNLKLPIQAEGIALDQLNCTNPNPTGTDVALATQVLSWAYGAFPGRFFAQLNFVTPNVIVTPNVNEKSPPDCVSPCQLDAVNLQTQMTVNPHSPYSVLNLIRQYQPQGVGLQDVAAAVDGFVDGCQQNGGMAPCTPCDSPPVQYATVSKNTLDVVQTYTPRFWEISRGDATTATGLDNTCGITGPEQAAMRTVFANATAQLVTSPTCAQNVDSEFYITRSGYVFNFGTQRFNQTVTLTNTGSEVMEGPIEGPIKLVLDNLSPNASLSNQSGVTTCAAPVGSPYIAATAATATLAPGASVSVVLEFSDPTKATTTYSPRMLAGSGTP